MFFPVLEHLLTKGDVILWESRAMGLNLKPDKVDLSDLSEIEEYFMEAITTVLNFFSAKNATFICHSFSSYFTLLYSIRHKDMTKKHIKQLLMLSPVGLTTKEEDYKN
jgi:pimeloyl-ACP methyl ester carboxylesterase